MTTKVSRKYKTEQERLAILNDNKDTTKTVWDSIDAPMRPLIFELSRIGMVPKFCCCGFSYSNEEEPKSHHASMCYVHMFVKNDEDCVENFKIFREKLLPASGFSIRRPFLNNEKLIMIWCNNPVENLYYKSDGFEKAIHDYEFYSMIIQSLACNIQNYPKWKKTFDEVTIVDGNSYYKKYKYWLVKPSLPFTIKVKDYYRKYGKLEENHGENFMFQFANVKDII